MLLFIIVVATKISVPAIVVDQIVIRFVLHGDQRRITCVNMHHPGRRATERLRGVPRPVVHADRRRDFFPTGHSTVQSYAAAKAAAIVIVVAFIVVVALLRW